MYIKENYVKQSSDMHNLTRSKQSIHSLLESHMYDALILHEKESKRESLTIFYSMFPWTNEIFV